MGTRDKQKPALRDVLASEWCTWIANNIVRGVEPSELVRGLVEAGVKRTLATRAVREIKSSPALHAVAAAAERERRLELALRLRRELADPIPSVIERRKKPSADLFFERYWAQGRPVVFTDATRGWKLWSPLDMKRLFGAQRIEVTSDRESDPDYDLNYRAHTRTTTVGAFVDRVLAAKGSTNDFYLVANNRAMRRAAFAKLLDRIVVDDAYFDPAVVRSAAGATSLWLGPKGTITPLHHDTTNILFHQVHGRKEVILVPPDDRAACASARGFYATGDAWKRVSPITKVILQPGEALFLPAGWWHQVRSLDVSISFSLLAFRRPNAFDWYRPGFPAF